MDIEILSQKFCDYSASIRGYSKNTIRRYRTIINNYSQYTGINEISQVTDDNVRNLFYHGRTERKWSVMVLLKNLV
jgi:site-specific recombinase XerD